MAKDPCAARAKVLLNEDNYTIYCCEDGHVHLHVTEPNGNLDLVLKDSNDAYTFGEAIMRAYDHLEGIEPTKRN